MNKLIKLGIVFAGYAVAWCMAFVAVYIRFMNTQDADAQASAGMYALGDFLLFISVFSVMALLPTWLALFFLRPFKKLWTMLSIGLLIFAVTGLCSVVAVFLASSQEPQPIWTQLAAFGVLRMLISPLLAGALAISIFIAPTWTSRYILCAATLIEASVGICSYIQWFSPFHLV